MDNAEQVNNSVGHPPKQRQSVSSSSPEVFTKIFQDDVNLTIWHSELSNQLLNSAQDLVRQQPNFKAVTTVTPQNTYQQMAERLADFEDKEALCQHISLLVDMFCTLFELKGAGLRLITLDRPMCPRFHVDKVPCRLVTTLFGEATQWLNHEVIDRTKLGAGSLGMADEHSGLIQDISDINQLSTGDIGLLKGEGWFDNSNAGLVHRSPHVNHNENRLLLTLDFIN
jgi:hypothetical protein